MEVKMTFSSSGNFRQRFENAKTAGIEAFLVVIENCVNTIYDFARLYAAVNTGQMQESIIKTFNQTPSGFTGVVEASGGLIYVEYGTGLLAGNAPKNGQQKNPDDISHRNKPWFIPFDILSQQQISDLRDKYKYQVFEREGKQMFLTYGQAPQPFMYPAAKQTWEIMEERGPAWFHAEFIKTV